MAVNFGTTVGGGGRNTASGFAAVIAGGGSGGNANAGGIDLSWPPQRGNLALGAWSSIGGGGSNAATGALATVFGGAWNTASGFGCVAAGVGATASHNNSGTFSFRDTASGRCESQGRGSVNFCVDSGVFVNGVAVAVDDNAGGNFFNKSLFSVVAGGSGNTASGERAFIGGGGATSLYPSQFNLANATASAVLGGYSNVAAGEGSVALGTFAHAGHDFSAVLGFQTYTSQACQSQGPGTVSICTSEGLFVDGVRGSRD